MEREIEKWLLEYRKEKDEKRRKVEGLYMKFRKLFHDAKVQGLYRKDGEGLRATGKKQVSDIPY